MRAPSFARFTIVTAKVAHSSPLAEGMAGAEVPSLDPGWLARLLAMPEPPTPPARQKGCAAPGGPPAARFILRRDHAEDDVVATRAQAVALPSAAPAAPAGQGPSDCRRSFAAPVFTRPASGCWHTREGRTCLAACSPVQNVGAGEAGGAHREARAHPV